MKGFHFSSAGERLSILCLGAHSDDIEIGLGATLIDMITRGLTIDVRWCVFSGSGLRENEARASAADFLIGAASSRIDVLPFRDGFFPQQGEEIKSWFESLKSSARPDFIFTHNRMDAHQDHREINQLTWNTFRDHCILEYEIPKWDGDMGQPNLFVPVTEAAQRRKVELLIKHFGTQRSKHWFDAETFNGLARLRGIECRAPERYAEAFFGRKLMLL